MIHCIMYSINILWKHVVHYSIHFWCLYSIWYTIEFGIFNILWWYSRIYYCPDLDFQYVGKRRTLSYRDGHAHIFVYDQLVRS